MSGHSELKQEIRRITNRNFQVRNYYKVLPSNVCRANGSINHGPCYRQQ